MGRTGAPAPDVTGLLRAWCRGDAAALESLLPLLYQDLRRGAAAQLRREPRGHTLQPTALVHEVVLRLLRQTRMNFDSRAHFLAVCAGLMRRVLIDHARRRRRIRRGGTWCRVELSQEPAAPVVHELDVLALDQALSELHALDADQARLVEMRFFAGLSTREAAGVLGVSERTVKRDWRSARAWLLHRLSEAPPTA
jgi:RNA polymerase sigma factor (TIGR02999 family)